MKFLSVDDQPMVVAIEAMDGLVTELSQSELVEAPDVEEALQLELRDAETARAAISEVGMTRELAGTVNVAVEGFLDRYPLNRFTYEPSIEGASLAIEALDEKRGNILQRFVAWLRQKMQASIEWLRKLFSRGGKAEATITKSKEMAQEVSDSHNPKEMAAMVKNPTAAAQGSRIDPADEKSGTFEDFAEALQKQVEPLAKDMAALYGRLNANQVLRVVVSNAEAVKSFYEHMEKTEASIGGVRNILNNAAAALRDVSNVQDSAQKIKLARMALYQELGGEDDKVFDTIRQSQFTDQNAQEITQESVPYDKLVESMIAVTRNITAANADARIRDLSYLEKAVGDLSVVGESAAFKRLPDADRDVLLTALNALLKDVSRYQAASMVNWNYVLQLHSGVGVFFNAELALYYRTIAAIQRAATQTMSGADRETLYANFKKQGFNLDLTEEDLQRRGVGTEHFSGDLLGDVRPMLALEDFGLEEMPAFPFTNPLGIGSGFMAALEAEEQAAQGDAPTRFAKLREWLGKLVQWFKNLFARSRAAAEEKIKKAREINKSQSEAVAAAKRAGVEIRPEVLKTFQAYLKDNAFWSAAGFAQRVEQKVQENQALAIALSKPAMADVLPGFTTMMTSLKEFMSQLRGVNDPKDLVDMSSSPHLGKFLEGRDRFDGARSKASNGRFSNAQELATAINDSRDTSGQLTDLLARTMMSDIGYTGILIDLGKKVDGWSASQVQSQDMQAAAAIFPEVQKVLQSYLAAEGLVSSMSLELLTAAILSRKEVVQAMFAAAKEKDANTVLYTNQEMILLAEKDLWGISGLGMESVVVALETLDAQMDAYSTVPEPLVSLGLEDDQSSPEAKAGILARMKAWIGRILNWITSIFKRKQEDQAKQMEAAQAVDAKNQERAKAAEQEPPARDEVVKIFEGYLKDHSWYQNSMVRKKDLGDISKFGMKLVFSPNGLQTYDEAFATILKEAEELMQRYSNVASMEELGAIPQVKFSELVRSLYADVDFKGYSSLEEHAKVCLKIRAHTLTFNGNSTKIDKLMRNLQVVVKRLEAMADKAAMASETGYSAANKALNQLQAMLVYVDAANKVTVKASLGILMGTGLDQNAAIKEIFADYAEKNPESEVRISQSDIEKLRLLPVWHEKRRS